MWYDPSRSGVSRLDTPVRMSSARLPAGRTGTGKLKEGPWLSGLPRKSRTGCRSSMSSARPSSSRNRARRSRACARSTARRPRRSTSHPVARAGNASAAAWVAMSSASSCSATRSRFPEALKTLAARAGVELDEHSSREDARTGAPARGARQRDRLVPQRPDRPRLGQARPRLPRTAAASATRRSRPTSWAGRLPAGTRCRAS